MKKKIKLFLSVIAVIVFGTIIYSLLWGRLFPHAPFFIGFDKQELNNVIIYVQEGAEFSDFTGIDTLTKSVELFHELKFMDKPKIFIFKDDESYLQRSISKARFCAFYNGNIVISPWAIKEADEGKISLNIYLRHELSHSILFQNKGILSAYKYPKWLLEGIAVYSTDQMGTSFYPSRSETYTLIKNGNFMPPEYFETDKEDEIKINYKYPQAFVYSEFACIVDYLITNYGREKLIQYMKALLEENDNHSVFKRIYNISFEKVINNFKLVVNENS
jgi:hypothetical protein